MSDGGVAPLVEGMFRVDGRTLTLLGGRSSSGRSHFPLQPVCPWTGADDVEPVDLPRGGRLWQCTEVTAAPPGYHGPVPYGLGVVELSDGLRVVGRVLPGASGGSPLDLPVGAPMELVADEVSDGEGNPATIWAFAPVRDHEANGVGDSASPTGAVPTGAGPTGAGPTGAGPTGVVPSDAGPVGAAPIGVPVAIAGVGLHPFGRFGATTAHAMGTMALAEAMAEAQVGRGDFQAAFCATAYGGVASGHRVLGALGLTGVPIVDVEAGCASGGAALSLAAAAISSGRYDTVLVVGIEKMGAGMIRSSFFEPWMESAGLSAGPAYFALRAKRLMDEQGITEADLAALVVKNRAAGQHNPDAMFRTAVTAGEVLDSRLVCDPLRLFMLCAPNEGAAAVVMRRSDLTPAGSPKLLAAALRSHLPGSVLDESTPLSGIDDTGITPPSSLAAGDAYEAAGVGPEDLDVVECQDTDAARELLVWSELGLCAPGEQPAILADGRFGPEGNLPVNQSGGLLSKGEPLGASGLGQVVELVRQLRGEAGARQVRGARIGLAHTIGRGANASVTLLGTDADAG